MSISQVNSPLEPAEILNGVSIVDLSVDGKSVARHEGRVIFLDKGLPGDVVTVRVTGKRKGSLQGEVVELERQSPHTVTPWCPHSDACGACTWQNFSPAAALEWKRAYVEQTLRRIGKTSVPVSPCEPSPLERGYRNKMAFAFGENEEDGLILGLRVRGDKQVIPVPHCGIMPDSAMEIVAFVRTMAVENGLRAYSASDTRNRDASQTGMLRFLVLHCPTNSPEGPRFLVECITSPCGSDTKTKQVLQKMAQQLSEAFPVSGFVHSERASRAEVAQGEKLVYSSGDRHIVESYNDLSLKFPYNIFMQTNTSTAAKMYALAVEAAQLTGNEVVWDLYTGVGCIALSLAGKAKEVYGFEIQNDAVSAAKENSRNLGFANCRFRSGKMMPQLLKAPTPDVILLDPPRAGVEREVLDYLKSVPASRMIYISCDVATQARDAGLLAPEWKAVASIPIDMFPYTPHVENLLVLEKINKEI